MRVCIMDFFRRKRNKPVSCKSHRRRQVMKVEAKLLDYTASVVYTEHPFMKYLRGET